MILFAFAPDPAFAEKRVALVIGNAAYQNLPELPNPTRDAKAIAGSLVFKSSRGGTTWGQLEFKRSLRDFERNVQDADIAVVFYAGHGTQIGDENYMIPSTLRFCEGMTSRRKRFLLSASLKL